MEKITSLQNPLIKQLRALREARMRRQMSMTVIDGAREIGRARRAGVAIERLLYVKDAQRDLVKELEGAGIKTVETSGAIMEKLAYGERHEGVLALARTPALDFKDLKLSPEPFVVVLDSLEKPGNLGAILRTCDGAGVEAVLVCDPKTDVYNPNVIRSSTGTVFSLPVVCQTREAILDFLMSRKVKVCASTPSASRSYTEADLGGALCLVMGSEDSGLDEFWLSKAHLSVRVPMKGEADSLNVSTCAAIILYEAVRQRERSN